MIALPAAAQKTDKVRYQGEINVGCAVGIGADAEDRWGFETIHGVRINPHVFCGAGLGVHHFSGMDRTFIPVFFDVKAYFLKKADTPYFSLDAGYSAAADGETPQDGFVYLCPAFGMSWGIGRSAAVNFSCGYQFYLDRAPKYWSGADDSVQSMSAILLRVSLSF